MPTPTGDLLDTAQCAALLGVHPVTLSIWRKQKRGPAWSQGGDCRVILYARKDIDAWLASSRVQPHAVSSTAAVAKKRGAAK